MKKRLLLIALFAGAAGSSFAQQDKVLTHFMFDRTTFNPAATALTKNAICGTFIYRNQWDKINGAPNSGTFNVEADLDQYVPGLFGGISFFQDMIGFNRSNFATLNVGYSLKNLVGYDIRIGAGIGMINHSVTPTWVPPETLVDPNLVPSWSRTGFDANLGLFFRHTLQQGTRTGDEFNAGFSVTHIPATSLESGSVGGTTGTIPLGFQTARHFYFSGGYKFNKLVAQRDDIDINFLVQSDIVETSFQINARYMYNNFLWGGLAYRTEDMIGVLAGVNLQGINSALPPIQIGYAYDFTINQLSTISQGSHEIMARYCYPLPGIPITKTRHPRWL